MRLFAAVLASALSLQGTLGEVQVLPFGQFKARDGRPGPGKSWQVDNQRGMQLAADLNAIAAQTPIVIDYEHQTLLTAENGQAAPAAGWMRSFEWRDGKGLWAKVEWTAPAKARIENGEYRYFSPVITFDGHGNVTGVQLGALVNHPGLLGMEAAVAQLSTLFNPNDPEHRHMDLLVALAALFAMANTTTPEQMLAHITALKTSADALKAQLEQLPQLADKLGLDKASTIDALGAKIDLLKTEALKAGGTDTATLQAMQALQAEVASLRTKLNDGELTDLVDGAIKEQQLLPAQRDWAVELGKKDIAMLKSYLKAAPKLTGLAGQSGGQGPGDGTAALGAIESSVMAQFGLTQEQYKAAAAKAH